MVQNVNRRAGVPASRFRLAGLGSSRKKDSEKLASSASSLEAAAVTFQSADRCRVTSLVCRGTASLAFDLAEKEHVIVRMVGLNC